ncbi:MAG: FHA domain-containing protein [Halofilum sp. (in: g-proteobacteria)]|nr:FHA domain-containing protein [Halofilum sp. (in: g-proteobacteria)]
MAKLTLTFNDAPVSEYELDKEEITIGRKPDNDIQIDNLAVSGRHARILTILNDSFLEDTNSTNGTYVNGTLVKKHALQNGDVIAIGKHKLTYSNEQASSGGDFDKTMIIRPDTKGMPESEGGDSVHKSVGEIGKKLLAEAEQQSDGAATQKARLRVISGTNKGKELELTKALTTIGKPGVQVAAVTRRAKGYFLIQIEAKDGGHPTVDGKPVGTEATPLANEAVIEVAGVKMEFLLD